MRVGLDSHYATLERRNDVVRRLLLWRHGETEYNAANRMQGQLDIALSDRGRKQISMAAAVLASHHPLIVRSSDLRRAAETADTLARLVELPVQRDPRLRETYLGKWQGMTHIEVDEQYPGERRIWRNSATWSPPGGESRVQVAYRTATVVEDLLAELPDWGSGDRPNSPVVLVAHGGCIAALTACLLGLPVDKWPTLGRLANANWAQLSAHQFEAEEKSLSWRLDIWNTGVYEETH